jgi:hypothetical protein
MYWDGCGLPHIMCRVRTKDQEWCCFGNEGPIRKVEGRHGTQIPRTIAFQIHGISNDHLTNMIPYYLFTLAISTLILLFPIFFEILKKTKILNNFFLLRKILNIQRNIYFTCQNFKISKLFEQTYVDTTKFTMIYTFSELYRPPTRNTNQRTKQTRRCPSTNCH